MIDQLKPSIVRILSVTGEVVGAGFLANDNTILTCAHVVAQALSISQTVADVPSAPVALDFPLIEPGNRFSARVVRWPPVQAGETVLATGPAATEDIAVLELDGTPPIGSKPLRLVEQSDLGGHVFRAFGFPSAYDAGVWASGLLRDTQTSGGVQIEDFKGAGCSVVLGFSGTPVWDVKAKGVVGIVVVAETRRDLGSAVVIPTSELVKAWPALSKSVDHGISQLSTFQHTSVQDERNPGRGRIFISYKRNSDPDEAVALQVFQALSQHHDVFIDQTMIVGTRWAERIESELRRSDFLITFLSPESVNSEMVLGEIETAHRLSKEQAGRPGILPIRLAYHAPFNYPLSAYLNHINWAYWHGPGDTEHLIEELMMAIGGSELTIDTAAFTREVTQVTETSLLPQPLPQAQPISLEMPEGTMDSESSFYKERISDELALDAIKNQGVTITIKGPRQMGKSSLLIRILAAAAKSDKRTVLLDFQLIDKGALTKADIFFRQFCYWLTDNLELEDKVEEYFNSPLGNVQCCTRYISRHILKDISSGLVLAMDEVDSIFESDFRSDFFAMLRSWHNSRAQNPIWKRLDLALVTSTEPYQLIENLNQSPFNVGVVIELTDFKREEVADLNRRHGSPLSAQEERQLMEMLGGHPYLVRRALYLISKHRMSLDALLSHAADDRGPFGDHLRYHLFRLHDKSDLVQAMLRVIYNQTCQDERIFFRLRGAGLVRREGHVVVPRCQLYADYFREHLHD